MKKKNIAFIFMQIIALLINTSILHAWTGNTWGAISRETIVRIADEMVDFSWTPRTNINNWNHGSVWQTFNAGTVYYGEAYTQSGTTANPQRNWAEFYSVVNNTTGGSTYYGNDCSGFVSISWRLPTRYTTSQFASDASSDGGYVTKLGEASTGQIIEGLLPGDALVQGGGHIILFESYLYDQSGNKSGIHVMEQTPPKARHWNWTWAQLTSYRPIRRNNIDEGDYVYKTKWGSRGTRSGQFSGPQGIAVDSLNNVYIVDTDNERIQKFDTNGRFITNWGTYGSGDRQFIYPLGIAVDSSSYIYVVDSYNSRIQKFTNNGWFVSKWGSDTGAGCVQGHFAYAHDIDVDSSNNVYVTDPSCYLQKFTSGGSFITWWSPVTVACHGFPGYIAVDGVRNVTYVSNEYCNDILKYSTNGGYLTKWGSSGSGNGQFQYSRGIDVDSSGNVYVVDAGNCRIQKFTNDGDFITKWGSYGTGSGQFQCATDVAVDFLLNVYVTDWCAHNIQKFAPVSKLPSGPSNLTATSVSSTQINLSWQRNSSNETGFRIQRKLGVSGAYSTISTVGANVTAYSDTVTPNGTYYYAVYAYNGYGDSAYSDEVKAESTPRPDIKANGSDNGIYVSRYTPVNITASLYPGIFLNANADWWAAYNTNTNVWYYYDYYSGRWTTRVAPAYQGPLIDLSPLSIFYNTLLPGTYTFYFGIDLLMNGVLDYAQLYYDSVTVTVY